MKTPRFLPTRWSVVLLLLAAATACAQEKRIVPLSFDLDDAPRRGMRFLLLDDEGARSNDIRHSDIRIRENGVDRPVISLGCPAPASPIRLSTVLAIDVSGSMGNGDNLAIAGGAARAWIDLLPLGYSDAAVTSFNHESMLLCDFTTDRVRLRQAVESLMPDGGTEYTSGLLGDPNGALTIARGGTHRKVVLFLTDGASTIDAEKAIEVCRRENVLVHVVVLKMAAPPALKRIATESGGEWFEGVDDVAEAEAIFRALLLVSQGEEPCRVVWDGLDLCEPVRDLEIAIPFHQATLSTTLNLPATSFPSLDAEPFGLSFGEVPPGQSARKSVRIVARHRPVTVDSLTISGGPFRLVDPVPLLPHVLNVGESMALVVEYAPLDSARRYATITSHSSACAVAPVMVSGGWAGIGGGPSVRIVRPNGGEIFALDGEIAIEWEGIALDDSVRLEFSANAGRTWTTISEEATGGRYLWSAPTISDSCLIRADLISAGGERGVITVRNPDGRVWASAFDRSGMLLATAGEDQLVRLRNRLDGSLIRSISFPQPIGQARSLEFSADGSRLLLTVNGPIAYMIDVATGAAQPIAHRSGITAALFVHDENKVVLATGRGSFVELRSGDLSVISESDSGLCNDVRSIAIDRSGSRIVVGGTDLTARSFVRPGYTDPRTMIGHRGWIYDLDLSADGSRLITSCFDSTLRIWDMSDGSTASRRAFTYGLLSARFDPNGTRAIIGGFDDEATIIDAATGRTIRTLIGHRGAITSIDWSGDGWSIVTTSWDSTVRIWDLARVPDGADRSDDLWRIVPQPIVPLEIDMGGHDLGRVADSTVSRWLCNDSPLPLTIDSITIAPNGPFAIVSASTPVTLPPGACFPIELSFTPTVLAEHVDSMIIHAGPRRAVGLVRGRGEWGMIGLAADLVDFGDVVIGTRIDSLLTEQIRSQGSRDARVVALTMRHGIDAFTTDRSVIPQTIPPLGALDMTVGFAPQRKGRHEEIVQLSYTFEVDGENRVGTMAFLLRGNGICASEDEGRELSIGAVEFARPGETLQVPFIIDRDNPSTRRDRGYSLLLRFNSTLLAYLDTASLVIEREGETYLLIDGRWDGGSDTVALLPFILGLGNADTTAMTIESFLFDNECGAEIAYENGAVRLRDLCRDGGTRLFLLTDTVGLKAIAPNPIVDRAEIVVDLIEVGRTSLTLIDLRGTTVATLFDEERTPGRVVLDFERNDLPSGRYVLQLRTPSGLIVTPLILQ